MPIQTTHKLMKQSFSLMWKVAEFLFKRWHLQKKTGAAFARGKDTKSFLSPWNKGLLLDGHSLRLSEEVSFQNVAVYGVTGKGKSSVFVRPIIFDKSKKDAVVNRGAKRVSITE